MDARPAPDDGDGARTPEQYVARLLAAHLILSEREGTGKVLRGRETKERRVEKSLLGPTLASLIESGAIAAPAVVRGDAQGTAVEATVEKDGTITYRGKTFNSPSVAAGHAITATTGFTTPGRSYASVNGWTFWRIADAGGHWRSLKDVRDGA